ncbi:hypothetical protein Q2T43_02115 [Aeromonas veronii]|uniref:Uncharacterized protein n=1 Tax=Aeromonas veronii TaxID=654 RepID=A0AAX2UVW6_AERVE|nr:hypothetical protein [Aeromonas veronii]MDO2434996.1 hypothetical protein [Aeromonas veronii]TND55087.1 hypothetical protein CF123_07475 [Aeromonas veronii]
MVTEQTLNAPLRGVSAEFGYYPVFCNIETDSFSIRTLPEHESIVAVVSGDPNVLNGWIYPGAQQYREFMSGKVCSMPYNARVFGLPMTHVLTLSEDRNREELDFVVWCLSFFIGMRLTTTEAGFLDATPIQPGRLVDFILSRCTITDVIEVALDYLESERGDARVPKRVTAVIHALFLAQYPQNLSFEKFQYLYMALDACFALVEAKEAKDAKKRSIPHAGRVQWMCEKFGIPVPDWAKNSKMTPSSLSLARNNTFHEAMFFDGPLGFASYGGNQHSAGQENIPLQMEALVCRLLVAILGKPGVSYVKTSVNTRGIHALELRG